MLSEWRYRKREVIVSWHIQRVKRVKFVQMLDTNERRCYNDLAFAITQLSRLLAIHTQHRADLQWKGGGFRFDAMEGFPLINPIFEGGTVMKKVTALAIALLLTFALVPGSVFGGG